MKTEPTLFFDEHRINQQGLVVYETRDVPTQEDPPLRDFFVMGICLESHALLSYNRQEVAIGLHDVGFAMPNHTLTCLSPSRDYRVAFVFISIDFFRELTHRSSLMDYRKYFYHPIIHLSDEQFKKVMGMIQALKIVSESDYDQRRDCLSAILDVLFYEFKNCTGDELEKTELEMRYEQLFNDFYDLLENNYKEHRDIAWYADQLSLSPKYFSFVIRQFTGQGAREWISDMIITEAKKLLFTQRYRNIGQIAHALGFDESGSFCRFFKSRTGQRPSQYRTGQSRRKN